MAEAGTRHVDAIILVHGNHGYGSDYDVIRAELAAQLPTKLVLVSRCNEWLKTHDGIDVCGERLTDEIANWVSEVTLPRRLENTAVDGNNPQPVEVRLTFVCHSLGGLIARYAAPKIKKYDFKEHIQIQLHSYISLCSPHLGSRRPASPGSSWMKSMWRTAVHAVVGNLYGKTGTQLLLEDEEELILKMADPDREYMNTLAEFNHLLLVSMSHHDHAVPYAASAIAPAKFYPATTCGLPGSWQLAGITGFLSKPLLPSLLNEVERSKYPIVLENQYGEECEMNDATQKAATEGMFIDPSGGVEYNGECAKNLNSLPWRRLDVEYTPKNTLERLRVHGFVIGKNQKCMEESLAFIKILVSIISHDLEDFTTVSSC